MVPAAARCGEGLPTVSPAHGAERLRPGILGSFGASGTAPRCSLSSALGSSEVAQTFSRASTIGQMYSAGSIANRKWGAWVRGVLPGAAAALGTGSGIPPPLGQELAYAACPRLPLACDRSVSRVVLGGSETPRRGLLWRGHGESPAMAARASTTSEAQRGGEGSGGEATTPLPEAHPPPPQADRGRCRRPRR